jgi:hypothetical protein
MTPESLKLWREQLFGKGYGTHSRQTAADTLGLSLRAYESYENGNHRIPRYIALACAGVRWHWRDFPTTEAGRKLFNAPDDYGHLSDPPRAQQHKLGGGK